MKASSQDQLRHLFAAYFHEDWDVVAETSDGIIEVFIAAHPGRNELTHFADLVEACITEIPDDQALEEVLFEDLGCYYDPTATGQSARSWMRDISRKLRAASERAS